MHVNIVHEFDNVELIKRTVEAGFSIIPRKAVTSEVQVGTLRQLEIAEGPCEHLVGILTRKHVQRPVSAQKLITALLSSKH